MIALDTNVLIRYLLEDDPVQSRASRALIEGELSDQRPGFISLVVLCELAWLLGHSYRHSRERIASAIAMLLEVRQVQIEDREIVARALADTKAGIADAIIHQVGKAAGCERTVTFDRRFARLDGVELLGS